MGDTITGPAFDFQARMGLRRVTRDVELLPYDENYFATEIALGVEIPTSYVLHNEIARLNIISDLGFSYTGGDEKNIGSHIFSLAARGGVRIRLFDVLFLDGTVGAGWAYNRLNFGKGFPLPVENTINLQANLTFGAEFCWDRVCVAPFAGFSWDMSLNAPLYQGAFFNGGFRMSWRPDYAHSDHADIAEPPDECPGCGEKKFVLPPNVVEQVITANLVEFGLERYTYYTNDNPDFDIQVEWFGHQGGTAAPCLANAKLDNYIRTLKRWGEKFEDLKRMGGTDTIEIVLRMKGYANDTGAPARNADLALFRSQGVIDYLTKGGAISHLREVFPELFARRRVQIMKKYGIDLNRVTLRHACGAQDSAGRNIGTLAPLLAPNGFLKVVNENVTTPQNPVADIHTDFATIDPDDPSLRRARIAIEILKNGQPLPAAERARMLAYFSGTGQEEQP